MSRDISLLHRDLKNCFEYCKPVFDKENDCTVILTHTHRTLQEQQDLYAKGRTAPGPKVTNCDGVKNKSKHNFLPALAFDVAFIKDKKAVWDDKYFIIFSKIVEKYCQQFEKKIVWGGNFKSLKDLPHYEL